MDRRRPYHDITPLNVHALSDEVNLHAHTIPAQSGVDIQTRGQADLYVVDNKFDPSGTAGWHSHPGPSLVLVISGTVTNCSSYVPQCAGRTYSTGQSFVGRGILARAVQGPSCSPHCS